MSAGGWNFLIDQWNFDVTIESHTHETHQALLAIHQARILCRSICLERVQNFRPYPIIEMKELLIMIAVALAFICTVSAWQRATKPDFAICPLCNQKTK